MTLALITRLARLSYEADASDAERLMTDAEFEEWLEDEAEMGAHQVLGDAIDGMTEQQAEVVLNLCKSPVHSALVAKMFRDSLKSVCARSCASRADGHRLIESLLSPLRQSLDHYDAIGADRRAMSKESRNG
jgi:hypothetical protein